VSSCVYDLNLIIYVIHLLAHYVADVWRDELNCWIVHENLPQQIAGKATVKNATVKTEVEVLKDSAIDGRIFLYESSHNTLP
jgi:hypothetical protein